MLYKLILKTSPTHIVICKDVNKYNYRYDIYKEYKANRQKIPEDLCKQT